MYYTNYELGRFGEKVAAKYLESKGYDIIQKNFMCRQGEIDIIARDFNELVFIEVKTTTGSVETPFYISVNEKSFFEENKNNNAYIYRVYNFNPETSHGLIKIISAKDLFENYNFDPISFIVTPK